MEVGSRVGCRAAGAFSFGRARQKRRCTGSTLCPRCFSVLYVSTPTRNDFKMLQFNAPSRELYCSRFLHYIDHTSNTKLHAVATRFVNTLRFRRQLRRNESSGKETHRRRGLMLLVRHLELATPGSSPATDARWSAGPTNARRRNLFQLCCLPLGPVHPSKRCDIHPSYPIFGSPTECRHSERDPRAARGLSPPPRSPRREELPSRGPRRPTRWSDGDKPDPP